MSDLDNSLRILQQEYEAHMTQEQLEKWQEYCRERNALITQKRQKPDKVENVFSHGVDL